MFLLSKTLKMVSGAKRGIFKLTPVSKGFPDAKTVRNIGKSRFGY